MEITTIEPVAKQRGFALLSPERRAEVARMGGKTRVRLGVGHFWTSEEARVAGRRGGAKSRRRPRVQRGEQPL